MVYDLSILEFEKQNKYVQCDVCMLEMAYVFQKRLKYLGSDVDLLEMAKICGQWLMYLTTA